MELNSSNETNLLMRLEGIASAASSCSLHIENIKDKSNDLDIVSCFLNITKEQALFFSCLTALSLQKTVTLDCLAKHFKCSALKLINHIQQIEVLEKKGFVQRIIKKRTRNYSYNDLGFTVPHYVIEALRKEDSSLLIRQTKFDLPGFLKQIHDIITERKERNLTTSQLMNEIEFLISNNLDLPFVSYVDTSLTHIISKCTVFAFSFVRLKGQINVCIERFADAIFDDLSDQLEYIQNIFIGEHELIHKKILKPVTSEFDGERVITLDELIIKRLYQSYPELVFSDSTAPKLISHKSLIKKDLYFNKNISEQLVELEAILQPQKFRSYIRILERNSLEKGLTAILYGAPGTGKTEMVYQIAKKTGRDIMMVDLSQTKNKWFGESEKRIKQLFDEYAVCLKNSSREPILFINEADGLLTKRSEIYSGSSSADQTINTIQNILLQSLEKFEGILIATTNLSGNLDRAFERRFAFKMEFPKPDIITRKTIWSSKLPELTEIQASWLAEKFDMTGGDIDSQIRQIIMKKILSQGSDLFELAVAICKRNHGLSGSKKLGF